MLCYNCMQCVCTGHTGIGHSLSLFILTLAIMHDELHTWVLAVIPLLHHPTRDMEKDTCAQLTENFSRRP